MTKPTPPDFITIDPAKDKQELIAKFEAETDTTLQPAQDAMILINLMVYYANLVKSQVNDAARLNLVEYSRYPILDFLGKYKKCERIEAHKGIDRLQITLNTTFSYDIIIKKGFQCKTNDGAYIFESNKDLIIPAGEKVGIVEIESLEATSELNKYKSNEITVVISSAYSYIESIKNLDGVSGASNDEDDDSYIDRILLAPEGFSVAGPELAYKYFVKSSHSSIVDASVDTPKEDIEIEINNNKTIVKDSGTINTDVANITVNYLDETVLITNNVSLDAGSTILVKIPHPYKVNIDVLTADGTTPQTVLDIIEANLKNVRPLSDYVILNSAEIKTFEISGTIYLEENADEEIVKSNVNKVLNNFINEIKNHLNISVIKNKITTAVCNIDGIYDFKLTKPTKTLDAKKNIAYQGIIGTLNYERVV